MLTYVTN